MDDLNITCGLLMAKWDVTSYGILLNSNQLFLVNEFLRKSDHAIKSVKSTGNIKGFHFIQEKFLELQH